MNEANMLPLYEMPAGISEVVIVEHRCSNSIVHADAIFVRPDRICVADASARGIARTHRIRNHPSAWWMREQDVEGRIGFTPEYSRVMRAWDGALSLVVFIGGLTFCPLSGSFSAPGAHNTCARIYEIYEDMRGMGARERFDAALKIADANLQTPSFKVRACRRSVSGNLATMGEMRRRMMIIGGTAAWWGVNARYSRDDVAKFLGIEPERPQEIQIQKAIQRRIRRHPSRVSRATARFFRLAASAAEISKYIKTATK